MTYEVYDKSTETVIICSVHECNFVFLTFDNASSQSLTANARRTYNLVNL